MINIVCVDLRWIESGQDDVPCQLFFAALSTSLPSHSLHHLCMIFQTVRRDREIKIRAGQHHLTAGQSLKYREWHKGFWDKWKKNLQANRCKNLEKGRTISKSQHECPFFSILKANTWTTQASQVYIWSLNILEWLLRSI